MTDSYWLQHCPKPRPRPPGYDWDAFISYRSADRIWALALYDMLQQCGYKIFLDQYVLTAGSGVLSQLSANLRRSASGVIVWSERSEDSAWVEREVSAMVELKDSRANTSLPFNFVAAKLDSEPLPALLAGSLYIDFSSYPDGPTGGELARLTHGLAGTALDPAAVARMAAFDAQVHEEPALLRGMVASEQFDQLRDRALSGDVAYTTSATLCGLAVELLLSRKGREGDALTVLDQAQARFRRSVRLRQLRGLALRRSGRIQEALLELEKLRADGHNDPETLGILAATWTATWKSSRNRDHLERARDLYAQAFERTPSDTYSGINAASKSAMLGEMDAAKEIAQRVLDILQKRSAERGGQPASDYWEQVTEPEALFLLGDYARALKLYHSARIAHLGETASIQSTWDQLELLLAIPGIPDEWQTRYRTEFAAFTKK